MDPTTSEWLNLLFRWVHVIAGVMWIGHLYFFNFVNAQLAKTYDADSKKKVIPELMPRALYWFRWGAAFTWITGVILYLVIYMGKAANYANGLNMDEGISNRGIWILVGFLFGTVMAFNVWFIIWPAQKKIIPAVRDGEAPPAGLPQRAALASKINTFLSVPLLLTMVSNSIPSLYGVELAGSNLVFLALMVVIGLAFGAVVQRTNFCAMGAVSDFVVFGDSRRLRAWALEAGFDRAGVARLGPSSHGRPFLRWLSRGDQAAMGSRESVDGVGDGPVARAPAVARHVLRDLDLEASRVAVLLQNSRCSLPGGVVSPQMQ